MEDWRLRNINPVIPDYSKGLAAIDDAVEYRSDRADKRRAAEQYKRQNDLAEKRLAEQNVRDRTKHEMDVSKRNEDISAKVAELARQGRLKEAEVLSRSAAYIDPRTGEQRSPEFDPGGERMNPDFNPLKLQMPEPGAPNEGGEAAPSPMGMQLKRPDVPSPEQYQGIASMMGTTRRVIKPSMVMPGGDRVEFDPEEGQRFKLEQAGQEADRLAQAAAAPGTPPDLARKYLAESERIRASLGGASNQHLRNTELMEDKQQFQGEQAGKYDLTAEQKMQLQRERMARKAAAGGKKPSDERADTKLELAITQAGRLLAKDIAAQNGYKEIQLQNGKFNSMAGQLAADPNAALDAVTAGSFVKMAQGGTGVVSDQDMEVFWKRIGGAENRSWQWVQNVIDGKINPEKRAEVAEAVQWLAQNAKGKLDDIRDKMEWQFLQDPVLKARADQFIGGYFGDARTEIKARQDGGAKPKAPAGAPPPAAKPGAAATPPPAKGPVQGKEGEEKTLSGGTKVVFRGGRWVPR